MPSTGASLLRRPELFVRLTHAFYRPWQPPAGARLGDLVTCSLRPNHDANLPTTPEGWCRNGSAYCEPSFGSALDCFLTVKGPIPPPSTTRTGPSAGTVVGAVFGTLAGVGLAGSLAFWLHKRRSTRASWSKGLAELGADEAEYAPLAPGTRGDFAVVYAPPAGAGGALPPTGASPFTSS